MTALTLRVWATGAASAARDGWLLACCAVIAICALSGLVLTVAYVTVTPMQDVVLVALLPLALAGSATTAALLPRRRPAGACRVARPRRAPTAPGATAARPALTRGGAGRAAHSRPAAAPRTIPAAAGPIYHAGRATVPQGAAP